VPPLPAVANVLRVTLVGTLSTDTDVINRFFVQYSGTAPTAAQLNTLASSIASDWNSQLASSAQSGYTLTGVEIEDLTSASAAIGAWTGSHAGTRAGALFGAGTAVVVRFIIARRYRGGHPRVYLPYFTSADLNTEQAWLSASVSGLVTAWKAFMAAVIAHTWSGATISNQVNVSYFHGFTNYTKPSGRESSRPTLRGTPLVDVVTDTSVNPHVASQRRRNLQ